MGESVMYVIRDWDKNYETSESRKRESLAWVAMPTDQQGLAYRTIVEDHTNNAAAILGVWSQLLAVVGKIKKKDRDGRLISKGIPLNAADLKRIIGIPADTIQMALDVLSSPEIGWIDAIFADSASQLADIVSAPADSAATPAEPAAPLAEIASFGFRSKIEAKSEKTAESAGALATSAGRPADSAATPARSAATAALHNLTRPNITEPPPIVPQGDGGGFLKPILVENQGDKSNLPPCWRDVVVKYGAIEYERKRNHPTNPVRNAEKYSNGLIKTIENGYIDKFFEIQLEVEEFEKKRVEREKNSVEMVARKVYMALTNARRKEIDRVVGKKLGLSNEEEGYGFFGPYAKLYVESIREIIPDKFEQLREITA